MNTLIGTWWTFLHRCLGQMSWTNVLDKRRRQTSRDFSVRATAMRFVPQLPIRFVPQIDNNKVRPTAN